MSAAAFDLDREVARYRRAKHALDNSRPGSPADRSARSVIDVVVRRAERAGSLDALLAVIHQPGRNNP